ncbi:glutamate racemase [Candidatus Kaiserbacteria bacterium]|nr:glutamate racemase [Candidatus Kaiserbacteria bacterium]
MARRASIGVFDSGFGGLAILKDVVKKLPQYSYVYLGDSARAPYGPRSSEDIYAFTVQAIEFLFAKKCDLVILACNTTSAEALRKIQQTYLPKKHPTKRVLGVIVPALEEAAARSHSGRIGVIATEGTVASGTFPREMNLRRKDARVFQQAAPLLVPLVEAGEHRTKEANELLIQYLRPLLAENIDTLILGCTHYGHLATRIKKIIGKRTSLISEGPVVARKLAAYIMHHSEIESGLMRKKCVVFYSTEPSLHFRKLGTEFYGNTIRRVLRAKL